MITFSFDSWDHARSWWIPNTITSDAMHPPATHGRWYYDAGGLQPRQRDYLSDHPNVRYALVSEMRGAKHLHVICVHDPGYFTAQADIGFSTISPQVVSDVREGRCRIVMLMPYEAHVGYGHHATTPAIIDAWCAAAGFSQGAVWLINGDRAVPSVSQGRLWTQLSTVACMSWMSDSFTEHITYQPVDSADLYLCYNRVGRPHRTLLLCELASRGLIDRGMISFQGEHAATVSQQISALAPDLMPQAAWLSSNMPLHLDCDLAMANPVNHVVVDHHRRTMLSVVTETECDGALFPTDKIFKVLCSGHPFMVVSSPGYLAMLRGLGYETFGQWWDETYDDEPDLRRRICMIIDSLQRLSRCDHSQLQRMRHDMASLLDHNVARFNDARRRATAGHDDDAIYAAVRQIWDGF